MLHPSVTIPGRRAWLLAAVVAILLMATLLRFHRLGAQSFWNDEGNSARLSERSLAAIVEGTAADIHPPLYYVLLRGWRELAGDTEFGLRALSAFAGVLTVATTAALARHAAGAAREPLVTVVAVLLVAMSPVLVYYSQETRMYALLALLAALSTWSLLQWAGGAGRRWAAAYVLFATAGLYTHYFFPAILAAHGSWVLLAHWQRRAIVVAWLAQALIAVALYAPWLPILARQVGGRAGEWAGLRDFLVDSVRWLVLGSTIGRDEALWALVAAVLLAVFGIVVARWRAAPALALVVAPPVLMTVVGATDPAYFKFLLASVPFLCLLMGLAWLVPRRGRWLPALLTTSVLIGSTLSLAHLYGDPAYARANYRAIAARIASDPRNTAVILVAPNQWEVFTYYHRAGAPVYPLPAGQPDPGLLEPQLARIAAAHERLYVLYWGERQRDPERVIERWLDARTFKAHEEWVGDVRLAIYAVLPETAAVLPIPSGATFAALDGETITLREYTIWPASAQPGDVVAVRLEWSADRATVRPYKVFVHLLAQDGPPVAQRDSEPGGGSQPTTTWGPEEVVIDNHGLLIPAGLLPGEYALRLGLYDAFDPVARLPVGGSDSLLLGTIVVGESPGE